MNKTTAFDVADEIRRYLPSVRSVKLQALLYYCQVRHMNRFGTAMFDEPIEAWRHGPVVVDVWRADRYQTGRPSSRTVPLTVSQQVAEVCAELGSVCDFAIAKKVRQELPWIQAWEERPPNSLAGPMDIDSIQTHHGSAGATRGEDGQSEPDSALVLEPSTSFGPREAQVAGQKRPLVGSST